MPYITKYNASSMLARIKSLDITTEGLYKSELLPLSIKEQQWLATVKKILEGEVISIDHRFIIQNRTDTRQFVYEGYAPSYHEDKDCEKLNNDYKNYELPVEIRMREDSVIDRFRDFVRKNENLLDENPNRFEMMARVQFLLKQPTGMTRLFAENSGAAEENTNVEMLEENIDKLIKEAELFKRKNDDNLWIVSVYGDKSKQKLSCPEDNKILSQWHQIKSDIKGNLKYYFMIKHNPSLNFRSSLLEQLNFRPCSTCCKRKNYDSWEDEWIEWANINRISKDEFPRDKQKITAITNLCLTCKMFTDIPESIGNMSNLTHLILWSTELIKLPESIGMLKNLTYLRLWDNRLTTLPESIINLTNLTHLELMEDYLTELPESIGNLTNLTVLDLSGNKITKLPKFIGKLTNLKELDLRDNPIKSLPPELSHLQHITKF